MNKKKTFKKTSGHFNFHWFSLFQNTEKCKLNSILESRIQGSRFFTDLRPLYSDGQQPRDQPRPRNFSFRIRIQGYIFELKFFV
jgi:hypothetical protein